MLNKLNSKKIIAIGAVSLCIIALGIVYVVIGAKVGHEVPKTQVATEQNDNAAVLSQEVRAPTDELAPKPEPVQPDIGSDSFSNASSSTDSSVTSKSNPKASNKSRLNKEGLLSF